MALPPRTSRPARPIAWAAFAAAAALVAAGCASAEKSPTASAIIIPRTGRAAAAEPAEKTPAGKAGPEEAARRLADVRRLLRMQDYEAALAALDELRALDAPYAAAREAEALRVEAKQHLLQSMVLDALVVLDHERVSVGEPVTGEVVLVNLGREPVEIPARSAGSGRQAMSVTTLHFDVGYTEYGVDGTQYQERITWNLDVGDDTALPAGGRRSWPLNLDTAQFSPASLNYRTYSVSAVLYPADILIAGESWAGNLRFRPRTCPVFPRNWRHLAADPPARLAEAIAKQSPVHVPLAAALVDDGGHDAAVALLLEVLGRPGGAAPDAPTRTACCVALRILTGEPLPAEAPAWLAWNRERGRRKE